MTLLRRHRVLIVLLVIALIARAGVVIASDDYRTSYDAGDYHRHALSISAGDGFPDSVFVDGPSAFRPPLYPYVLGATYFVSGDSVTAGRLAGALLGVLTVLLIYMIALTALRDRRIALAAAALAAVAPPLVLPSKALATEPLFLAVMMGAVLLALYARERGGDLRLAAAAGACCGLAALTRSNGVLLVIPIAFGLWRFGPRPSRPRLGSLAAPTVAVVAALLTIAPWTVRNAVELGQFVPVASQPGFGAVGTYNDDAAEVDGYTAIWTVPTDVESLKPIYARTDLTEAELDDELRSRAIEYATDHPGYVIEATFWNALRIVQAADEHPRTDEANELQLSLSGAEARVERLSFYLLAALAAVGMVVARRRPREHRLPAFVWAIPVLMVMVVLPILATTRYRMPAYPFLVLAAAPALVAAADRLSERRRSPIAR